MAKRTEKEFYITNPNDFASYLLGRGIKVYPVHDKSGWKIEVSRGSKTRTGSKVYKTSKELNEGLYTALEFTYKSVRSNETGKLNRKT